MCNCYCAFSRNDFFLASDWLRGPYTYLLLWETTLYVHISFLRHHGREAELRRLPAVSWQPPPLIDEIPTRTTLIEAVMHFEKLLFHVICSCV